jgi:two-component system cell cycle response regulator
VDPPVVVLRSEDFASIDDMLRAREAIAAPVLFRVEAAALDHVLEALRDGDDVCLAGDPPSLVEFRTRMIARRNAAGIDRLTGLVDRSSFVRALTGDPPAALLVINLDHLKQFNDQHGHMAGDMVLRAAAIRTRAAVPTDALVARTGGDVFSVALAAHHDPRAVAAAIRAAFHATPIYEGATMTVSIGLVVRSTETDYLELASHAEAAVYAAKARGRDCCVAHADRVREARERDGDVELDGFEDMTRVLADRVADVISWRGRRVFQELREQADTDGLTGLHSRRYLDRRLPFEIESARERKGPLSVALLDVDHFGRVNKEHGWPTGDKVLADTAARIRGALRTTDWAARYGGEEICIVLDAALADAREALDRVRTAVAAAAFTTTSDAPLAITVSIGCAELEPTDTLASLIERASARLLEAKGTGRNQVR